MIYGSDHENQVIQTWLSTIADPRCNGIELVCLKQGWGHIRSGLSIVDAPICLNGNVYEHGIGTHADSVIEVRSAQPMTRFQAIAGLDDNRNSRGVSSALKLIFSIEAGGCEIWRSAPLGLQDSPAQVDVDLGGVRQCTLKVKSANGDLNFAHADWAQAVVTLLDGRKIVAGPSKSHMPTATGVPFSFRYGGRHSSELLTGWLRSDGRVMSQGATTVETTSWKDSQSGLVCILELKRFANFPAAEWVLRFRNEGTADTHLLEEIEPLDLCWPATEVPILHHALGSHSQIDDFAYLSKNLQQRISLLAGQGRSSQDYLPFFNLETGGGGVMAAIGWSGQWRAEFEPVLAAAHMRAGMEKTHMVLHPEEEIRTPRILIISYDGSAVRGHNLLRRIILQHYTPAALGQPPLGPTCCATWGGSRSAQHQELIRTIQAHGLPFDYYWMDAGWYGPDARHPEITSGGDWYLHTGDWRVNPQVHPEGLRPLSDAAARTGMKFLLWLEPERINAGTPIATAHPEWLLQSSGQNSLFNLGLPDARAHLINEISAVIQNNNVRCYRQDFNIEPLEHWRRNDAPDRQGMTEIRYIEGLYAFWDALLARHPGLLIDNCASGGRRIDLETTSRSIPLWRSDWQCSPGFEPIGTQQHLLGLSYWVPMSTAGTFALPEDTYDFRSALSTGIVVERWGAFEAPMTRDESYPWEWLKSRMLEAVRARPFFTGDYYPLFPIQASAELWAGAQYHMPESNSGMIMLFRRPKCPYEQAALKLAGLDDDARYCIEDADDSHYGKTMTGRELRADGVSVSIHHVRESKLLFYRAV